MTVVWEHFVLKAEGITEDFDSKIDKFGLSSMTMNGGGGIIILCVAFS